MPWRTYSAQPEAAEEAPKRHRHVGHMKLGDVSEAERLGRNRNWLLPQGFDEPMLVKMTSGQDVTIQPVSSLRPADVDRAVDTLYEDNRTCTLMVPVTYIALPVTRPHTHPVQFTSSSS